ncbi:hypothetical protein HY212_05805 [Candidatus Pacearchaeota archaeon]|nr:hypothetical protein [Candidatus Pacearchaeota archaeon]
MEREDRYFISELILIVAGFIIAETISKKFLEVTNGLVSWWFLPLIAISFVGIAINIKHGFKQDIGSYLPSVLFVLLILFLGLQNKGMINKDVSGIIILIILIAFFIIYIFNLKKNRRKTK